MRAEAYPAILAAVALCAHNQAPLDICNKAPASADMALVLRPMSKMLVDCTSDVIIRYKLVRGICKYHALCAQHYRTNRTQEALRAAEQCFVQHITENMPQRVRSKSFDNDAVTALLISCSLSHLDVPLDDAEKMNAVLHWLYEASYAKMS